MTYNLERREYSNKIALFVVEKIYVCAIESHLKDSLGNWVFSSVSKLVLSMLLYLCKYSIVLVFLVLCNVAVLLLD